MKRFPSSVYKIRVGETKDWAEASFILADGGLLPYVSDHERTANRALWGKCPTLNCMGDFMAESGAIRYIRGKTPFLEIHRQGGVPTAEQVGRIRELCDELSGKGCNVDVRTLDDQWCGNGEHLRSEGVLELVERCIK